jgi:hypothetical protein
MHQIYEAAQSGHLPQAQQMIDQVLRDHPQSAKAHYVAAEVAAREGNLASARQELNTAKTLEPGLPFAKHDSVLALERELGQGQTMRTAPGYAPGFARPHSSIPWGVIILVVAGIAILWAVMRRRSTYVGYPSGVPAAAGPGGYGPAGYGPGYGPGPGYGGGPGMGSGLAGGLASGLAVGAGVVAGEELAHHFLDGDRREGEVLPREDNPQNGDMGGSDFGVSDGGGSWDDGGGSVGGDVGGGGGGDDWT